MIIYYTEEFAGGHEKSRRLLKRAITEYTADADRAERLIRELRTGEHGKPYIEGFDCFSVSHTGSIWAVLFGEHECGLDIQLGKECDCAAISRRIYPPEDAERIAELVNASADDGNAYDEFFRLWTRREALAKALGGSVYDPGLPSAAVDHPCVNGNAYTVFDIGTSVISVPDGKKLYASVCVEKAGAGSAEPLELKRLV